MFGHWDASSAHRPSFRGSHTAQRGQFHSRCSGHWRRCNRCPCRRGGHQCGATSHRSQCLCWSKRAALSPVHRPWRAEPCTGNRAATSRCPAGFCPRKESPEPKALRPCPTPCWRNRAAWPNRPSPNHRAASHGAQGFATIGP